MDNNPYDFEEGVYVSNTTQKTRDQDKAYQKFLAWKAVRRDLTLESFISSVGAIRENECQTEGAPKFCTVAGRMLLRANYEQSMKEHHARSLAEAKATP